MERISLSFRRLAIAGMEKNTGKTTCLNRVLQEYGGRGCVAVTSIGVDGERVDLLTGGSKPEIELSEGMLFGTSQRDFSRKRLDAAILAASSHSTALGVTVTARVMGGGRVRLSGPSTNEQLMAWIEQAECFGAELTVVDGALNRMMAASPAVCEAMILSTGAALSADMNTLVRQTAFMVGLIRLPVVDDYAMAVGAGSERGIWIMNGKEVRKITDRSVLSIDADCFEELKSGESIILSGALTDGFVNGLMEAGFEGSVVVDDFTKIFCSQPLFERFVRSGGSVRVRRRTNLLALTVNPVAPNGMRLDSQELCERLRQATNIKVYDLLRC